VFGLHQSPSQLGILENLFRLLGDFGQLVKVVEIE
jgi:hypothetical protein